jgi:hypothetical protein
MATGDSVGASDTRAINTSVTVQAQHPLALAAMLQLAASINRVA